MRTEAAADPVTRTVRWLARGLSLVAAGMILLFFVAPGGPDPMTLSTLEAELMLLFLTAWVGLLVAWRWEVLGAAMTVGGLLLFCALEWWATGRLPRGPAFGLVALPGLLFLYCGLRARFMPARSAA
jgi:hypothetical protein